MSVNKYFLLIFLIIIYPLRGDDSIKISGNASIESDLGYVTDDYLSYYQLLETQYSNRLVIQNFGNLNLNIDFDFLKLQIKISQDFNNISSSSLFTNNWNLNSSIWNSIFFDIGNADIGKTFSSFFSSSFNYSLLDGSLIDKYNEPFNMQLTWLPDMSNTISLVIFPGDCIENTKYGILYYTTFYDIEVGTALLLYNFINYNQNPDFIVYDKCLSRISLKTNIHNIQIYSDALVMNFNPNQYALYNGSEYDSYSLESNNLYFKILFGSILFFNNPKSELCVEYLYNSTGFTESDVRNFYDRYNNSLLYSELRYVSGSLLAIGGMRTNYIGSSWRIYFNDFNLLFGSLTNIDSISMKSFFEYCMNLGDVKLTLAIAYAFHLTDQRFVVEFDAISLNPALYLKLSSDF